MSNKFLSYLVTGALGVMLALASPAFGRGGGGGGGHFGGMGGGMHYGGMGGGHFAGTHFAHAGFHGGFGHRVFDHRLHRFVFIGAPFAYASYDSCYRRVWTPVGLQWVNVCGDYNYGY